MCSRRSASSATQDLRSACAKKARTSDATSTDEKTTSTGPLLTRVDRAPTGRAHCGWCDTLIAKGSVRVVRHFYHAPGQYSRDDGAATGFNSGGWQDEYSHAQCSFFLERRTRLVQCCQCKGEVNAGLHFFTSFAPSTGRCEFTPQRKKWMHTKCVRAFLTTHGALLESVLSEQTQFDATVAWKKPSVTEGIASSFFGGKPDDSAHRAVFRLSSDDAVKAGALEAHAALQEVIATRIVQKHNK